MNKPFDRQDFAEFQSAIDNWRSKVYDTDDPSVQKLYQSDARKLQQILEFLKYGKTAPAKKIFKTLDRMLYSQIPDKIREFLQGNAPITESFHGDITKAFPSLIKHPDTMNDVVSIIDHAVRDKDVRDALIQISSLLNADGYIEKTAETTPPDSFWKNTVALIIDRGNENLPTLIYDVESRDFIVSDMASYVKSIEAYDPEVEEQLQETISSRSPQMINEEITSQYLYVYDGPGGPVTKIFTADSDSAAMDLAKSNSSTWFDDQENDLGLEPDALVDKKSIQGKGFFSFGFMDIGVRERVYRSVARISSIQEGASTSFGIQAYLYVYDGPEQQGPVSVFVDARTLEDALRTVDNEFVEWIEEGLNDLLLAPGEKISKRVVEINGFLPLKFVKIGPYDRLFFDAGNEEESDFSASDEPEDTRKYSMSGEAEEEEDDDEGGAPDEEDEFLWELTSNGIKWKTQAPWSLVDIEGDVDISGRKLIDFPVAFGKISGDFDCSDNLLTDLFYAPTVVVGDFDCSHNRIPERAVVSFAKTADIGGKFISDFDIALPSKQDSDKSPEDAPEVVDEEKKRKKSSRMGIIPVVGFGRVFPYLPDEEPVEDGDSVSEKRGKSSPIDTLREKIRKSNSNK